MLPSHRLPPACPSPLQGNLVNWDTAILGLNAANPGGSMGIKSDCGSRKYRLITAGYPGGLGGGLVGATQHTRQCL